MARTKKNVKKPSRNTNRTLSKNKKGSRIKRKNQRNKKQKQKSKSRSQRGGGGEWNPGDHVRPKGMIDSHYIIICEDPNNTKSWYMGVEREGVFAGAGNYGESIPKSVENPENGWEKLGKDGNWKPNID